MTFVLRHAVVEQLALRWTAESMARFDLITSLLVFSLLVSWFVLAFVIADARKA